MAHPLATRRVGRYVNVSGGGSTQLHSFGPFLPGEGVKSLLLAVQSQGQLAGTNARVLVTLGVTSDKPASATVFSAQARMLTDSGNVAPALPVGGALGYVGSVDPIIAVDSQGPAYVLPVCWLATTEERYFSVLLKSDAGGGAIDGSLWMRTSGCPDPSPVVPPPPAVVEEDCE